MGVVHGDIVVDSRPIPRMFELIPAADFKLEFREGRASQIGVGGMNLLARIRCQMVGARGADTTCQGGCQGEVARVVARIEVTGAVVVGLNLGKGSVVGDGVGHGAGIGSPGGGAGDAQGVLLTECLCDERGDLVGPKSTLTVVLNVTVGAVT